MHEIQSRHLLMRDLWIHSHHLRMSEGGNKAQVVACGRHVDIGSRFVRFRFQRELVSVTLIDVVFAEEVHGFAQTLDRVIGPPARIGFDSFPSAPKNEDIGSQFCSQIHGLHRFLESVSAYLGVVRGKGSIAEDRIVEQRDRRHRYDDPIFAAGLLEFTDDAITFGAVCVDGNKIVVVQIHSPRSDLCQHGHDLYRRQGGTDCIAEGIATPIPQRP